LIEKPSVRSSPSIRQVKQIIDFISDKPTESGIVYCLRKTTEELAGKLKKSGVNAKAYHAGFDSASIAKPKTTS
jgi:ATP-dependent DNA helicase RecQ